MPVHKRWYRLRDSTAELTKVAKMLYSADTKLVNEGEEENDGDNVNQEDKKKNSPTKISRFSGNSVDLDESSSSEETRTADQRSSNKRGKCK